MSFFKNRLRQLEKRAARGGLAGRQDEKTGKGGRRIVWRDKDDIVTHSVEVDPLLAERPADVDDPIDRTADREYAKRAKDRVLLAVKEEPAAPPPPLPVKPGVSIHTPEEEEKEKARKKSVKPARLSRREIKADAKKKVDLKEQRLSAAEAEKERIKRVRAEAEVKHQQDLENLRRNDRAIRARDKAMGLTKGIQKGVRQW